MEKIVGIAIIFLILYLTQGTDGEACNPVMAYGLGC